MATRYDATVFGAGRNGLTDFSASLAGDGAAWSLIPRPCHTVCSLLQSRDLCGFWS